MSVESYLHDIVENTELAIKARIAEQNEVLAVLDASFPLVRAHLRATAEALAREPDSAEVRRDWSTAYAQAARHHRLQRQMRESLATLQQMCQRRETD